MPAKKGNNYWEFRGKHGRDFKYTPENLWDEAVKYFNWMSKRYWDKKEGVKSGMLAGSLIDIPTQTPLSVRTFCLYADIDDNTFNRYEGKPGYEDFWDVAKRIRAVIESNQFEGATVGAYNPNIIARTLGLVDKTDVTTGGEKLPGTTVDLSKLSAETLEELAKAQTDD